MTFRRIFDLNDDPELGAKVVAIHNEAFPEKQRVALESIDFRRQQMLHVSLTNDGRVACYSVTRLLGGGRVGYLSYIASDHRIRGKGVGQVHLAALSEMLEKLIVLEVDDPDHWEDDPYAVRRLAWYLRSGAVDSNILVKGINRADPSELLVYRLLALPCGAQPVTKEQLKEAGLLVLQEHYGLADDHVSVIEFLKQF